MCIMVLQAVQKISKRHVTSLELRQMNIQVTAFDTDDRLHGNELGLNRQIIPDYYCINI